MPSCEEIGIDVDDCMNGYDQCREGRECTEEWEDMYAECADACLPHPFLEPWDCAECTYEVYERAEECIELETACEEQLADCEDEFWSYWTCLEEHPYYKGD